MVENNNIVGTNLNGIHYYSSQQPFLDEFKSSKSWFTQTNGTWDTKEDDLLDLDDQGWVKSLPGSTEEAEFTKVSSLLFRTHGSYLPGKYVVLYEGEGNIEYKFDAEKIEELSTEGRDVIEVVEPSTEGILLSITSTDPDRTGDYIRDIKVVPEADESNAETEIFNPAFLEKIEPFGTLRFMDWMRTNDSTQKEWADRPKPEDVRYSTSAGAPVEIMVELANETDTNPWFTIPHQATDEYVANFAQYVKDNLEPELDVYVEYSNEVWNSQFDQHHWVKEQAEQEWPDSSDSEFTNTIDWYSKRTTEIVGIWDETFNEESERVIGVMAAQASNDWTGQRALNYEWSDSDLSHEDTGIDAIAIAPYFGDYIGGRNNEDILESWTKERDGGVGKVLQEIKEGGLLENGVEGGALEKAYGHISDYAELADKKGLDLLAYEGGQHLVGVGGVQDNEAITELLINANRNGEMAPIYGKYLNEWFDRGGDLFVNFSDIEKPSKHGSWGVLGSVYQSNSPKYHAINNFIEENSSFDPISGEVSQVADFDAADI